MKHKKWMDAMGNEFGALIRNETWELVPPSTHEKIINHKWVLLLN